VTVAPQAGHSKAVHARHWFDLVAHKVYTLDVIQNSCSWMTYTVPDMPAMYDPIAPPPIRRRPRRIQQEHRACGERERIAAKLSESSSAQGKSSIWVAANGNYPSRW